jgi:hypothetical protein
MRHQARVRERAARHMDIRSIDLNLLSRSMRCLPNAT